jgi:hypothetical protein
MIVTRDEILNAIKRIQTGEAAGLCEAFIGVPWWWSNHADRESRKLCRFLRATGGRGKHSTYFWSFGYQAKDQRLMFLAFMLTWYDELEALP